MDDVRFLGVHLPDLPQLAAVRVTLAGFIEAHGPRATSHLVSVGYAARPPVLLWTDRGLTPIGHAVFSVSQLKVELAIHPRPTDTGSP